MREPTLHLTVLFRREQAIEPSHLFGLHMSLQRLCEHVLIHMELVLLDNDANIVGFVIVLWEHGPNNHI